MKVSCCLAGQDGSSSEVADEKLFRYVRMFVITESVRSFEALTCMKQWPLAELMYGMPVIHTTALPCSSFWPPLTGGGCCTKCNQYALGAT